jgi:predicted RNA-binding protein
MCLSTVYVDCKGQHKKVMQDVAAMEAIADGYLLVDLFGVKKTVRGDIKYLDFVDEHTVLLEEPN